jgi:DNA-directed RNA polymerase specialized sigma24 family protein
MLCLVPRFPSTHWSLISQARRTDPAAAKAALQELCTTYSYPLYAWLRRRGYGEADAADALQGFFVAFLAGRSIERADRERGRFRSYVLAILRHHLAGEFDKAAAKKRGGGLHDLDLDDAERRYQNEDPGASPEQLYARRWATSVLDRVEAELRRTYHDSGRGPLYEALRPVLLGATADSHAEIAARMNMQPGAVKVAMHRLKKRYAEILRRTVADTVDDPSLVDQELRDLIAALDAAS